MVLAAAAAACSYSQSGYSTAAERQTVIVRSSTKRDRGSERSGSRSKGRAGAGRNGPGPQYMAISSTASRL